MKKLTIILICMVVFTSITIAEDYHTMEMQTDYTNIPDDIIGADLDDYMYNILENYIFDFQNEGGFMRVTVTLVPTRYFFARELNELPVPEITEEIVSTHKEIFNEYSHKYKENIYLYVRIVDSNVNKVDLDNIHFHYKDGDNAFFLTEENIVNQKATDTFFTGKKYKLSIEVEDIENINEISLIIFNNISDDSIPVQWEPPQ